MKKTQPLATLKLINNKIPKCIKTGSKEDIINLEICGPYDLRNMWTLCIKKYVDIMNEEICGHYELRNMGTL